MKRIYDASQKVYTGAKAEHIPMLDKDGVPPGFVGVKVKVQREEQHG